VANSKSRIIVITTDIHSDPNPDHDDHTFANNHALAHTTINIVHARDGADTSFNNDVSRRAHGCRLICN
jgi:hypothetical protein